MKTAYIIATDLHKTKKNFAHRKSFSAELEVAQSNIIECCSHYREQGYKVYILWLGDVFDRSYRDSFDLAAANNQFIYMLEVCDGMYSVIGNHELSYYADNPFWTLVRNIESKKIGKLNRVRQPVGVLPVLNIVDRLDDGNVTFHFNHYGTPCTELTFEECSAESGRINIGLFHQPICSKEIFEHAREMLKADIWQGDFRNIENEFPLHYYDYAYFGHLHKVYGTWKWTSNDHTVELNYLGALGRTDQTEIQDTFLERRLPVVCIDDGVFSRIEDWKFNLLSRQESVDEASVLRASDLYAFVTERKVIRESVVSVSDPINNLRLKLSGTGAAAVLDCVLEDGGTQVLNDISERIDNLKYGG